MPTFESFFGSIVVDGKPLDEYNVETSEVDGVTTVACWVSSEAGKVPIHISVAFHVKGISGQQNEAHWKDARCKLAGDGQLYIVWNSCRGKVLKQRNQVRKKSGFRVFPTFSKSLAWIQTGIINSGFPRLTEHRGNLLEDDVLEISSCNIGLVELRGIQY